MDDLAHRVQRLEDVQAIELLNREYARLIDAGELAAFAELFRDAVWRDCAGADAVLKWLQGNVRLYDGTPRTHHLVSGLTIDVDGSTAEGRSTITVYLQPEPGDPILPITVSDYHDEYVRVGGEWRFRSRKVARRLEGDMTAHLRDQRA